MIKETMDTLLNSTKNLSILYVEDDRIARESTVVFLKTVFDNITIAIDGEDGYEKYKTSKFDIIITDVNMPKLSGLEMLERIRKDDTSIPILILSAYDDTNYFVQSIKHGVDGYLLKPIQSLQFFTIITKIVKRIDLEKAVIEYQTNLEAKVEEKTRELRHRCYHEFYTDLPNSKKLQVDMLDKTFSHILLLDMSHFSTINKEYGKAFGNHVIVRTARILEYHIHKKAKLYKTESDRFIIMLKEASTDEVHEYCKQIVAFFDTKNVKIDDAELHITFNIGVSAIQDDIAETLINTEYALEKSKALGSRHYDIFDNDCNSFRDEKEAIKWLRTTRTLILEEKIEAYFQPIKDINTNEILKYEVLARGILGDEVIAPHFFIAPSDKLGLITSITRMMINKSFAFFENKKYNFSINITERDLLEKYLVDFLQEKVKQYNIDPSRVTFEILENITLAKNSTTIVSQLNLLREKGFKIAIDDFGIENSNFSRLLELNLDFIKIDGVFIKNLKENTKNRTITRAIVNLSKTLGIKTIAEYVEDEEIYDIVKECGIDYAQGYYVGKPKSCLLD